MRFLALEFGLAGKNSVEQGQVDCVYETVFEAYEPVGKILGVIMKGAKVNLKIKNLMNLKPSNLIFKPDMGPYLKDDAPYYLGQIEKLIKLFGSNGYSVGSGITYADLYIHEVCKTSILNNDPTEKVLDNFPNIKKVIETVDANPRVSAYLKLRPARPI